MRDYLEKMVSGSKAIIYNDKITMISSYNSEREFSSQMPHSCVIF